MKINYIRWLVSSLAILIISCQPRSAVKTDTVTAPDSVFYFEQADISDPFLDTIFHEPDQSMALNKKLYPPELPPDRFKEIEGFRVQVFAGTDSANALANVYDLTTLVQDSVHFFQEKGLFKIQIGDYQWRYQADAMKTRMRQNGYSGAWVIQRSIIIPVDTTDTLEQKIDMSGEQIIQDSGKYKIQVIATGSQEKAEEITNKLRNELDFPVFFEQSGNLFKVFVGMFKEESVARQLLTRVRELGYADAWLVY
jgi:hypothetical protein